jgi:hypothetical protein
MQSRVKYKKQISIGQAIAMFKPKIFTVNTYDIKK